MHLLTGHITEEMLLNYQTCHSAVLQRRINKAIYRIYFRWPFSDVGFVDTIITVSIVVPVIRFCQISVIPPGATVSVVCQVRDDA